MKEMLGDSPSDWISRRIGSVPSETTIGGDPWPARAINASAAVRRDEAQATLHLERSLQLWEKAEDSCGTAGAFTALGARAI